MYEHSLGFFCLSLPYGFNTEQLTEVILLIYTDVAMGSNQGYLSLSFLADAGLKLPLVLLESLLCWV